MSPQRVGEQGRGATAWTFLILKGSCENDRFRSNILHQLVPRKKLLRKCVAFLLNMATEYRNNIYDTRQLNVRTPHGHTNARELR